MEQVSQLIEQGKKAFASQDWKTCLDSYAKAIELDPECEAVELRKMAMRIIEYYCKDRFNP